MGACAVVVPPLMRCQANQTAAPTAMTTAPITMAVAGLCVDAAGAAAAGGGGALGGGGDGDAEAGAGTATPVDVAVVFMAAASSGTMIVASELPACVAAASDFVVEAAAPIASANSCAVWYRSSAFLAIALRTTASITGSTWMLIDDGGSGSSFSTFCMVVVAEPENGRSPVRNW